MVTAKLNGTLLASSDSTVVVEGNHQYFPPDSIEKQYFEPSNTHTTCPWKGVASYHNVRVGETVVPDAAWYYPSTYDKAKEIEGYVAFYKNKVDVR
ncbi:hypothetical protein JCM10450v2_001403 [Rhodotorula kratochvilovae]